jgi:hypothetical protein
MNQGLPNLRAASTVAAIGTKVVFQFGGMVGLRAQLPENQTL